MNETTWSNVETYFDAELIPSDATLNDALRAAAAAGLPAIQVPPSQGKLLYLLALAQRSERVLEIGTLGGYSTLWLARANFARAGIDDRIELRLGPALDSFAELRAAKGAPFDLVFIDADKVNNLAYVQAALELTREGSLIVVDNVVREGAVVAEPRDASADAVRRLAEWVGKEPRLSATVIQTVGTKGYDGFLLARVGPAS
jgi:predicted O-methyltransferase YrrM